MHGASCDMGEIQQIINQHRHALGSRTHPLQLILAAGVEFVGIVLQESLAESVYAAERRPQIV